jgi:diguanylate cyclase (GGDEF)-like protein
MPLPPVSDRPEEAIDERKELTPGHRSSAWRRHALVLALLSGLAVLLNSLPVPLYFGVQVLLGSVPPILALLLWRTWWAVPMAFLASLQTWAPWGHPWAVVIFTLEMVWLTVAMRRFNGLARNDGNGRVVLFSLAYWLLLGAPLVFLFYGLVLGIDGANVLVVAVKQSFNGVFNTGLAFAALIVIRVVQARRGQGPGLSLRGVIVALALLAITVPTLVISQLAGQQLELAVQEGVLDGLRTVNLAVVRAGVQDPTPALLMRELRNDLAYRRLEPDGQSSSSDPVLFQRLDDAFQDSGRTHVRKGDLALLIPRGNLPPLRKWVNGYWSYSTQVNRGTGETALVQVVAPARAIVTRMQDQSTWLLATSMSVMALGALIGYWLGGLFDREFQRVIAPLQLQQDAAAMPSLQLSPVLELRNLALLINHRIRQVNRLALQLRQANATLRQSRNDLQQHLNIDPITGCGNRQALQARLKEEFHRCRRSGEPLSCLCLRVDNLVAINRTFGPQVGNTLLQGLTQAARPRLRITDHLFRCGDAFLVVAIGCPAGHARDLAQSLKNAMEGIYLASSGPGGPTQELRTRLSFGISSLDADAAGADDLPARARQDLERCRHASESLAADG